MPHRPARTFPIARAFLVGAVVATAGCQTRQVERQADSARLGDWSAPSLDTLGNGPEALAIRRGHALVLRTRDSLPRYVGGNLNCTSCHLQEGRKEGAIPLYGVYGMYPRYIARADAVVPIEDRVNYCFTRSLAGSRLPADSREMQDIVAYIAFLSRGIPAGTEVTPVTLAAMPKLTGDSTRGAALYVEGCARCHGANGEGIALVPALWGPASFSIGASMAREERAASFIRHNMPFDKPGTLTDQQAFDVAAYVTSLPRPDMPGKERDWPKGNAPGDVPYVTAEHRPPRTPKVLPRVRPGEAMVPPPKPVRGR
jgi:thiosulfate dehydrogenase